MNGTTGRRVTAALCAATLVITACSGEPHDRVSALDEAPARELVGVWDVTLRLDRPLTLAPIDNGSSREVAGTITLLEDHFGRPSYPQLTVPTHTGAYDVDFRPFGVNVRNSVDAPIVVARTGHDTSGAAALSLADSVFIVLNPGTSRYAVLLVGRLAGDTIAGIWSAESFLGGGGVFVLRRRSTH